MGLRAALDGLTTAENRLLRSLHIDPSPLLELKSPSAQMASWILMRLALFGPLPPVAPGDSSAVPDAW